MYFTSIIKRNINFISDKRIKLKYAQFPRSLESLFHIRNVLFNILIADFVTATINCRILQFNMTKWSIKKIALKL